MNLKNIIGFAMVVGTLAVVLVPNAFTVFVGVLTLISLGFSTVRALQKEKALVPVKIS
jgi:hypothetical protein